MALPVTNNNNAAPITTNGTFCTVQVPGWIPPSIAGSGSVPQFGALSYHIVGGSTGAGTVVTFQGQGADGVFRNLASPAPITIASGTTYNSTLTGSFGAAQIVVSGVVGNGLSYAQLTGSPLSAITGSGTVQAVMQFQSGSTITQLYIDPTQGDLVAKAITGPNAGKSVNLTSGKWL